MRLGQLLDWRYRNVIIIIIIIYLNAVEQLYCAADVVV